MAKRDYDFGEQTKEGEFEVWQSPKYKEARQKAIETIESDLFKGHITESDFWILKNKTKTGKIAYSGLIISHNGCLKINDLMPDEKKFKPSCLSLDKEGYKGSLVFTYVNDDQGLYEVGEVSTNNCQNAYPYAMALKRAIDRVILKNSRLAYAGIYSDSEAEEFKDPQEQTPAPTVKKQTTKKTSSKQSSKSETTLSEELTARQAFVKLVNDNGLDIRKIAQEYKLNNESTDEDFIVSHYDLEGRIEGGEFNNGN